MLNVSFVYFSLIWWCVNATVFIRDSVTVSFACFARLRNADGLFILGIPWEHWTNSVNRRHCTLVILFAFWFHDDGNRVALRLATSRPYKKKLVKKKSRIYATCDFYKIISKQSYDQDDQIAKIYHTSSFLAENKSEPELYSKHNFWKPNSKIFSSHAKTYR